MHLLSSIRQYALLLAATVVIVGGVLLNTRFGCETVTSGGSTVVRPGEGNNVIFERRAPRTDAYAHGEPVLYLVAQTRGDRLLTGKVAGKAGDTVGIVSGELVRNGEMIEDAITVKGFDDIPEFMVPAGTLWVLADNPGGRDSRSYGPVPVEAVRGKIVTGSDK